MSTTISLNNVLCLVAHSCLTLCDSMDCSPPGSSVHGDSPGKNTRVGCYACLQGIFPTWRSNPCLLHCRSILYCLNHQESIILSNMLAFAFLLTMSLKLGTLLLTSRVLSREVNGHPLQYSCLENPMDGGAWWAAVHEVAKSQT